MASKSALRHLAAFAARSSASSSPFAKRATISIPRQQTSKAFSTSRRAAAEAAPEAQPVVKRRSAGFFRWTWRLTKLGLLGGSVWMAYGIYQSRTPAEQADPDPSKKTLVVLGKLGDAFGVHEKGRRKARRRDGADIWTQALAGAPSLC